MTKQIPIIKLIILIVLMIVTAVPNTFGQTYKYIFFNNLDPEFAESAYLNNFDSYPGLQDYKPYLLSVPFNSATFSKYNITDFDLAIFPMGDYPLNYTSGSYSVIKKIKEMIAAGKNVLITGRQILYKALSPSGSDKNPEVIDFLENTMGIDYIHRKQVHKVEGNTTTWWSFIIHGHFQDPIGKSIRKGCNMNYNGGDPLAYYMSLDIFFTKDKDKYFQVEHFIYDDSYERNDTIVATRTEIGKSRVVLYAMGFEAFAGEIPRASLLHRCMVWSLGNIKPDGAVLQFDPVFLDFERVDVDSTRELPFEIKNIGKEDLVVTETSFFDNPDDAFKITEGEIKSGDKPITLKTGETHPMKVSFTPKQKIEYAALLSIYSNSLTGNIKDINCLGIGGHENSGPKIETNYGTLIDFGKLKKGRSKTVYLAFYNPGDKELTVQKCKMDTTMPDHDLFTFAQVLNTPFFVKPGDSVLVKVKFAAIENEERVYNSKILIESNAMNNPNFDIDLKGEIYTPTDVSDEPNEIGSLKVLPNPVNKNDFNVAVDLNNINPANIEIYISDVLGNRIQNVYNGVLNTSGRFNVDASRLASGVYFVVTQINSKKIITRMVVEK